MNIPEDVICILNQLKQHNFPSYLVGGCVRDAYMKKIPKDWDITTQATPEQVKNIFKKTFDTGIQHGTVTVVLNKNNYEVTTFRVDGRYEDHRKPKEVFFTSDLIEDLSRRDFTMNAIAFAPGEGYIDPFHGLLDIDRGLIRAVGDAKERFFEDALRMLRAVRFSAQLDFTIEDSTFSALKAHHSLILNMSKERIRDELVKSFMADYVENTLILKEIGIIDAILPELDDIFKENICTLKKYKEKKKSVCLATVFSGVRGDVEAIFKRLAFDNQLIKRVCAILQHKDIGPLSDLQIKKIISNIGVEAFEDLLLFLGLCKPDLALILKMRYQEIKSDCIFMKDLQVNGNDLIAAGFKKGPELGQVLQKLLFYVHENPFCNEKGFLIEKAIEMKN